MTEQEKMDRGLWHDANFDPELLALRMKSDDLCFEFNQTRPSDIEKQNQILKELLGELGDGTTILSPLYADYGSRTKLGEGCFINHSAYFMDCGGITLGNHCFIGPSCGFYTSNHPLLASDRNIGYEIAKPIVLEDDVWLGGGVRILSGVRIGQGSVIGAGSVVTKDIPAGVLAYGVPCKVIRKITKADSISDLLMQQNTGKEIADEN